MDNTMKKRPDDQRDIFWPPVLLRAKIIYWWAIISHPTNRRLLAAGLLEFIGLGIVLYGLYLLHTLAFIVGFGATCMLLAQGIGRRDDQ